MKSPQLLNSAIARGRLRRPAFWQLTMRCAQVASILDVIFFFLFLALDSPILAWVNVISVPIYVCAYYALKNRRNRFAVWLIWTEVLVHAALGILMIGWESGFHYYLLMFIPAICLTAPRKWSVPWLVLLWAYYVSLNTLMRIILPIQPIPDVALHLVHMFNLTVVFAMFSYLSAFYLGVVTRVQKKLQKMAITDPLTGLLNRRQTQYLLDQEIERFKRSGGPAGIMVLDVDHFKRINDENGHDYGDTVLKNIAETIHEGLRSQDLISRWGGEEFLAILPQSSLKDALQTAERIRAVVESKTSQRAKGITDTVTVSIGVTELRPGDDATKAISRADAAMYQSKAEGRNRVTGT